MPRYHLPRRCALAIVRDAVLGRHRSFLADARVLVKGNPSLRVLGPVPDLRRPSPGSGWLITVNHYSAPGFRAWWLPISLTAVLGCEVRWVITSALTFKDFFLSRSYTPLSEWFLPRLARTYDFFPMPPMPPRSGEVEARAHAARAVLRYVRTADAPVVGLAPEGGDSPDQRLSLPPSGAGRFLAQLAASGLIFLPVGAYETEGSFCLNFGAPYNLPASLPADPDARDAHVARVVFRAIADLLPARLVPPGLVDLSGRVDAG